MIKLGKKSSIVIGIKDDFIDILIGNSKKIKLADTIPLEEGLCEEGIIKDVDKIADVLLKYFGEKNVKEKEVSFIVFGSDVISRYIQIPKMKNTSFRKSIEFEFRELVTNEEDYYIDYEIINEEKVNKKKILDVLVAACTKKKIDKIVELSEVIGKKLVVIDILTNTLNKIISNSDLNYNNETVATFYLGYKFCNVSISENGILKLDRNIPFGFKNIIKDIQRYREEAGIKSGKTIDFYSRDFRLEGNNIYSLFKTYPRIEETFNQLLAIVNKTLKFYSSGKGERIIDEMIVISILELSNSEISYIEKYFDLDVKSIKDLNEIGFKIKNSINNFEKYMPLYGVYLRRE